jgi:hypothetical protein
MLGCYGGTGREVYTGGESVLVRELAGEARVVGRGMIALLKWSIFCAETA